MCGDCGLQDQYIMAYIMHEAWADCDSEATCLAAVKAGKAAIVRHPSQFRYYHLLGY